MQLPKSLKSLRKESLHELVAHFDLSAPAAGFVTPRASIQTVLASLLNHNHFFDAATLLAHALPKRRAVWWAASAASWHAKAYPVASEPKALVAIKSAQAWVMEPEEDYRIAAHRASLLVSPRAPAHWAAMSVFWSAGNITPGSGVTTAPPPFLYARGVAAAIDLAANLSGLERESSYRHLLAQGVDIAAGGDGSGGQVSSL